MLLLLRGHIRDSFKTQDLYNFVRNLYNKYAVDIYLQTWSVFSNSISWRHVMANPAAVTEDIIRAYFKDIPIKDILILDDTKITLTGNNSGKILASITPLEGWKNMWYGKAALAAHVAQLEAADTPLINTRFDLFCMPNNPPLSDPYTFIAMNKDTRLSPAVFILPYVSHSIDNIYMTTVGFNVRLSQHFNENLDEILRTKNYSHLVHHEHLVFFENMRLFMRKKATIYVMPPRYRPKLAAR